MPLSMLTTVTPGEQVCSIASSAASPLPPAPYPVDVGTATTGTATSPPTRVGKAPSIPATTTTASMSRRDAHVVGAQNSHVHGFGNHSRLLGNIDIGAACGQDADGAGGRLGRWPPAQAPGRPEDLELHPACGGAQGYVMAFGHPG